MKLITPYIFFYLILLFCLNKACAQNAWIDSVKNVATLQKSYTNNVRTLITLSGACLFYSPDSRFSYGQRALTLAEKLQFDDGMFWAIVFINKSLFTLGNYALELDYAFKAYPLGYKINNSFTVGWANGMMGDAYFNLGEDSTALKY
jgi:hypothetical protein